MDPSLNVVLDIFAIVFAVTAGVHWNFSRCRTHVECCNPGASGDVLLTRLYRLQGKGQCR